MNRSEELALIDYAVIKTMEKGEAYSQLENIKNSLKIYFYEGNSHGFTRTDNARDSICKLNYLDIERELLKNIIKCDSLKRKVYTGLAGVLGTNKKYDDDLSIDEAEMLVLRAITEKSMDDVICILRKYPKLLDLLIDSFVTKRYYSASYGINNLDNVEIIDECSQPLLDKIDNYYDTKLGVNNIRKM